MRQNVKEQQTDKDTLPLPLRIEPKFVADKFGISAEELMGLLGTHAWPSLRYRVIEGGEHDEIMQGIASRIESGNLRIVGNNDNQVWEQGWGEILAQINAKGFHPSILRPQYFDHHRIMRLSGHYIDGGDARFVYEYDQLLRRAVLARYLRNAKKIVEIGCGTGTSQLLLAELLPDAELVAADWAKPSQDIICAIAHYLKREIEPVNFNMLTLEGLENLSIDNTTAVLTVHALEQIGGNYRLFLETLLRAKPRYCLHLEPIVELYNHTDPFDALAIRYHKHRNYLDGWLSRLRDLARQGKVEIIEERRLGFGDRYHEAYSVIQWRAI